ncbi:lipase family alpha/beta hydrolase [Nocardioides sp. MAHUQ-72]|uniref:lipase family alpha/beta hydrolase n=1 Tax=unclassified Nocardioides TaxID=2615069 RepID=UPI0036137104
MLDALSPARRRFFLVLAALAVLALLAGAAVALVRSRDEPVHAVPQSDPGPVLLVPGYGGSTEGLEVLAARLRAAGRDVTVVPAFDGGTGDLRAQARALADAAEAVLTRSGAGSVDVVGYSAGGVVVRLWVAEEGGGEVVRRAVTLASPHHGTDIAALGGDLAPDACPAACRQLSPDSDLMRRLATEDETPPGPLWVSIWTTDDQVVVPPESGRLDGSVAFAVQSVCPETLGHADVPRDPTVAAMVVLELGTDPPAVPGAGVCRGRATDQG